MENNAIIIVWWYELKHLREMDTYKGGTFQNFLALLSKGVYSKRKEFAPIGSKFSPFRLDPFSEGTGCVGK